MNELRAPGKRRIIVRDAAPNEGTHARYRNALQKAVARMVASYEYWLRGKYEQALRENVDADRLPDVDVAMDAAKPGQTPRRAANKLFAEMNRLRDYWNSYFDDFAKKLAQGFMDDVQRDNAATWHGRLKRAGFDIEMQLTPSQSLITDAMVRNNVALIKSIQQDYHKDIEGIVTRNFLAGRDLHTMADKIKTRGDVSTRRAALIARDQSNKATAQMNAARQRELDIRWARWIHSSAGKEPRPDHVKAGREQWYFNTQVGIDFGDGFGHVLPGEAIKCRCGSRSIIPSIGRDKDFDVANLEEVPGFPGAYRLKK